MNSDNVILFPKWKKSLEEESLEALKEKDYDIALLKLNQLLDYKVDDYEIITGKLICLMELGRFNEAQNLCEDLLKDESENYFNYVHIYLTILFQTSQYELLMQQVEYEFGKKQVPDMHREQFKQLYEISQKMKIDFTDEKSTVVFDDLFQAVDEHNHEKQWRQVENLRRMNIEPDNKIFFLLKNRDIHPVTKTAIYFWLKDFNVTKPVEIHKFGETLRVVPSMGEELNSSSWVVKTISELKGIEQKNPSLFQLLKKLLFDYAYVLYPIAPLEEDSIYIANALRRIGEASLNIDSTYNMEVNEKVSFYEERIKLCESLYLSVIDE